MRMSMLCLGVCAMVFSAHAAEKEVSPTLVKVLEARMNSLIDTGRKEAGQALPPGVTQEEMVKTLVNTLKPSLAVTPDEEAKFKKGEFDEAGNKQKMTALILQYKEQQTSIPAYMALSINEFQSGKLAGENLETVLRISKVTPEEFRLGVQELVKKLPPPPQK